MDVSSGCIFLLMRFHCGTTASSFTRRPQLGCQSSGQRGNQKSLPIAGNLGSFPPLQPQGPAALTSLSAQAQANGTGPASMAATCNRASFSTCLHRVWRTSDATVSMRQSCDKSWTRSSFLDST